MPLRRRGLIAGLVGVEAIAEVSHDQVLQAFVCRQGIAGLRQALGQIGRGDGHTGVGIGDVVLQLFRTVHRVHRDHDGIGAQDGEMGNHQLRAILHVQHHPVAALHAQAVQGGGQAFGLTRQLAIAVAGAKENQGVFMWVTSGIDGHVVPKGCFRQGDAVRQALGPKCVVRFHALSMT